MNTNFLSGPASTAGRLQTSYYVLPVWRRLCASRSNCGRRHTQHLNVEQRRVRARAAAPVQPPGPSSHQPAAVGSEAAGPSSYEWSFTEEQHACSSVTLTGDENLSQLLAALATAAGEERQLSQAAAGALETAMPPSKVAGLSRTDLVSLLTAAAAAGATPSAAWHAAATAAASAHISAAAHIVLKKTDDDPSAARAVSQLLWALSELGSAVTQPSQPDTSASASAATSSSSSSEPSTAPAAAATAPWLGDAAQAVLAAAQEGELLAPDLCAALCALGSLGYQPPESWLQDLAKEVEFQVVEFLADFGPIDIARLASGLADLGARPYLSSSFSPALMKAVYSKVRTIGDKAAVDFALAKLDTEERSMHYDPRWTHEELSWLPRRERDKRRIMKEGWFRTQWGGWAPGGRNV